MSFNYRLNVTRFPGIYQALNPKNKLVLFTKNLVPGIKVYNEELFTLDEKNKQIIDIPSISPGEYRLWDSFHSKLAAAILKGSDKIKIQIKQGLNILYSNQCPWVARSLNELEEVAKENGLELNITELKNAKDAQNAPSIYATFNLIYDGKILADHYVSKKRFQNIINKELKK